MLIDTHCHLTDPTLFDRLPKIIGDAQGAGVVGFVVPSVSPADWPRIASLAGRESRVWPAFGLHPMHASRFTADLLDELAEFSGQGAAIGEIGLDYLLTGVPRVKQVEAFRHQLRLAMRMKLPVLIHCRHAFSDLMHILREERFGETGGVMHAFSGSVEVARECIKLGLAISVAGPVTFLNAIRPVEVVSGTPLEHLLLETDSPDLTPEPYRGRLNEPAFLVEVARRVAEIKGAEIDRVAAITTANARRLFDVPNRSGRP